MKGLAPSLILFPPFPFKGKWQKRIEATLSYTNFKKQDNLDRKRNEFMMEEAKNELKRFKFLQALQEACGAWKDEEHPELSDNGTYHWVREQRQQDRILEV